MFLLPEIEALADSNILDLIVSGYIGQYFVNITQLMGLIRILLLTGIPATALVYSTFRLGKDLPKAARLMGNYIGLGYVYFKVIVKALRPAN